MKIWAALIAFCMVLSTTSVQKARAQTDLSKQEQMTPMKKASIGFLVSSGFCIVVAGILVLALPRDTTASPDAAGHLPHQSPGQEILLGVAIGIPVLGATGLILLAADSTSPPLSQSSKPPTQSQALLDIDL